MSAREEMEPSAGIELEDPDLGLRFPEMPDLDELGAIADDE
jgi:hypothetical protein